MPIWCFFCAALWMSEKILPDKTIGLKHANSQQQENKIEI